MNKNRINVGDTFHTLSGSCEVVKYLNCETVTIRFEDGTTQVCASYKLKRGLIKKSTKLVVGSVFNSATGKCTIIKYVSCDEVYVRFENGGELKCSAGHLRTGNVRNPIRSGLLRVGERFTTPIGLVYEVVNCLSKEEVVIRFIETGTILSVTTARCRIARIVDPLAKTVCNIGFVGVGSYPRNIKGKPTVAYTKWQGMISRCYGSKIKKDYIGVTVAKEWLNFQEFAGWFYTYYTKGLSLDKDLKSWGTREYSRENCTFITEQDNTKYSRKNYDFPIGFNVIQALSNREELSRYKLIKEIT